MQTVIYRDGQWALTAEAEAAGCDPVLGTKGPQLPIRLIRALSSVDFTVSTRPFLRSTAVSSSCIVTVFIVGSLRLLTRARNPLQSPLS
jgi:hypothetical protein